MKKIILKFQATPLGSFTKVFICTMIVFAIDAYINDTLTFPIDKNFMHSCFKAGIVATLPTLYNWFNPNYTNYGRKKIEPLEADRKV